METVDFKNVRPSGPLTQAINLLGYFAAKGGMEQRVLAPVLEMIRTVDQQIADLGPAFVLPPEFSKAENRFIIGIVMAAPQGINPNEDEEEIVDPDGEVIPVDVDDDEDEEEVVVTEDVPEEEEVAS